VRNRRPIAWIATSLSMVVLSTFLAAANTPPVAVFEVRSAPDGSATAVVFDASGSQDADGTIVSYQWIFGDGFSGSGVSKTHTYSTVSTYTVTLLVTDNAGGTSRLSRQIDLSQPLDGPAESATPQAAVAAVAPSNARIGIAVGNRAPEFTLLTPAGEPVSLSDFLGSVVLLEFWTNTCPACLAALPYLEELRTLFEGRGLVVVDVILSVRYDEALQYLDNYGFNGFFDLLESDPITRPTKNLYGVQRVPHAFLIDRTGVIRYSGHTGLLATDLIEPWL